MPEKAVSVRTPGEGLSTKRVSEVMDSLADALTALSRYVSRAQTKLLQLQSVAFDADLFLRHADAISN